MELDRVDKGGWQGFGLGVAAGMAGGQGLGVAGDGLAFSGYAAEFSADVAGEKDNEVGEQLGFKATVMRVSVRSV